MSGPFRDRLFRGYGPLIGFTAVFLAIVLLVPSQVPEGDGGEDADADVTSLTDLLEGDDEGLDAEVLDETLIDPETGLLIDPETGELIDPETGQRIARGGSGGGSGGGGGGRQGGGQQGGGGGGGGGQAAGAPQVAGCGDAQVPGDPYSPPCVQFSGSNGGATHRGVTPTEIVVAVRIDGFADGLVDAISTQAGAGAKLPRDTPEKIQRTIEGLGEYFNRRFQFYGRKLKLVLYNGKGDPLQEILGRGQEGAQADALRVAEEFKAFADVSAVTPEYASTLSSRGVVNIGAPYVSRNWLTSRRPYAWTPWTDCSTVVESVASYYAIKMAGKPAGNAGGDLKGKPRRTVIVAPSNDNYQTCVRAGVKLLQDAGKAGDLVDQYMYELKIESATDAANILAKMRSVGATTVICGCDPIFLNFLTARMAQQNYRPEMIVTGVALADNDLVGQLMEQSVWRNAFGVSFAGATQAEGQGIGYRAYKSINPDEPSIGVELIYNQFYLLAIGIQMAGPNLNPQTFERGMFNYPRRTGPYGTWAFGPNDYSTSVDAREIHWNPDATSVQTRTRGAYVDSNNGARFPIGRWPAGNPRSAG